MILITEIIKQETTIDLETLIFFTTSSTTLSDVNKVKDVRDFELDEKCVKQVTVVGRLKKSTLYWKNHLQVSNFFQCIIIIDSFEEHSTHFLRQKQQVKH